jgi:hypothetical protein
MLLIWDSYRAHTTAAVKEKLRASGVRTAVIPGGLTSMLQPLDLAVNKPFKERLKNKWTAWMAIAGLDRNAKVPSPTRLQVIKWIVEAWEEVPVSAIRAGFLKPKIIPQYLLSPPDTENANEFLRNSLMSEIDLPESELELMPA